MFQNINYHIILHLNSFFFSRLIGSFAIALSIGAFGVSVVEERQNGLKDKLHMVRNKYIYFSNFNH